MYDWEAAKEYYISAGWPSNVFLQDVAERYNIPYQTVRRRAAKERWRLIREWKSVEPELKSVDEYIYFYKQSADNPINFNATK